MTLLCRIWTCLQNIATFVEWYQIAPVILLLNDYAWMSLAHYVSCLENVKSLLLR